MAKSLLFAAALAALPVLTCAPLAFAPLAYAQTPAAPPALVRYAGVVIAVADDSLTIKDKDGATVVVPLARAWTVVATHPIDIEAIKPGSFVATANTNIDADTGKSIELRVFEPGNKGGEGSRPMAQPNTTMTNATVTTVTKGAVGRELDVAYPGGTRHIIVPPEVQVIGYTPVDRDRVKPGVTIAAAAAKGEDGVARVARLQIVEK